MGAVSRRDRKLTRQLYVFCESFVIREGKSSAARLKSGACITPFTGMVAGPLSVTFWS